MSAVDQIPIRLAEELILLMLNEQSGYLEMVPGWAFSCVMAGAVIADLALEERIDTDLNTLYLVDRSPTGDNLLDPTLKEIAESQETGTRNTGSNGTRAVPTKSSWPRSIAWWRGKSSTTERRILGALALRFTFENLSDPRPPDSPGSQSKNPERHFERHHPGPARCHPHCP